MDLKIMWAAAIAVFGWIFCYFFGRQFIYNLKTAYPLIKQMKETNSDLIADTAKKYTHVSMAAVSFLMLIFFFLAARFLPLYLKISFFAGFLVCLVMVFPSLTPDYRKNFDAFCTTYYRFVPDDELRTAMYNRKPSAMKIRLHDMGLSTAFIPEFRQEK